MIPMTEKELMLSEHLYIAKDIEVNLQYPGEVKVNVIREIRAVEIAR